MAGLRGQAVGLHHRGSADLSYCVAFSCQEKPSGRLVFETSSSTGRARHNLAQLCKLFLKRPASRAIASSRRFVGSLAEEVQRLNFVFICTCSLQDHPWRVLRFMMASSFR